LKIIIVSFLQEEGEFDWDATTQSIILASFYWCYILSQVVGGILTQYFGTKIVFGFSQLITAMCSLLIPSAAPSHYGAVIALRSIQGVASVSYVTNVSCSSLY
jgi:MFS family permease